MTRRSDSPWANLVSRFGPNRRQEIQCDVCQLVANLLPSNARSYVRSVRSLLVVLPLLLVAMPLLLGLPKEACEMQKRLDLTCPFRKRLGLGTKRKISAHDFIDCSKRLPFSEQRPTEKASTFHRFPRVGAVQTASSRVHTNSSRHHGTCLVGRPSVKTVSASWKQTDV